MKVSHEWLWVAQAKDDNVSCERPCALRTLVQGGEAENIFYAQQGM